MSSSPSSAPDARAPDVAVPLSLSVHSLPTPGAASMERPSAAARWKLLGIVLLCSLPAIATYVIFMVVRPQGHAAIGELITPVRTVPTLTASDPAGRPVTLPSLKGQWLIVSVGSGRCDDACSKRLFLQRQVRESLGKDKDRVDRVWFITDDAPLDPVLAANMKDATLLRIESPTLGQWLEAAPGQVLADHLYLVDPMGHWMMRFPAGLDLRGAAKAKRDLEHLLRASASWDAPGRVQP